MMKNKLYIAATPIGNLSDASFNLINILENIKIIFCEDTRVTQKLLLGLKINNKPKLVSYHKYNETEKQNLFNNYIQQNDILLVSDAGYPLISDPGFLLVKYCIKNNIDISIINGPCALIHALVKSGISTNNFYFHGFLNANNTKQQKELNDLKNIKKTLIFYESVHRIKNTLKNICLVFKNTEFVICKELTKIHETFFYLNTSDEKTINNLLDENNLKGEFVIVLDNNKTESENNNDDEWKQKVEYFKKLNLSNKLILQILLLDYKTKKNEIYGYLIQYDKNKN